MIMKQQNGTVYFMEWSHGVESWSGVIKWSLGANVGADRSA